MSVIWKSFFANGWFPVASSAVEPYEASAGVAAVDVEPYEATKSLAAPKAEPWEALKSLGATAIESWEALLGIAKTPVFGYDFYVGSSGAAIVDRKAVTKVAVVGAPPVASLTARIRVIGGVGVAKAVIYADSGGPGAKLAEGVEVTIQTTAFDGDWITLPLASPVALADGTYWIGAIGGGSVTMYITDAQPSTPGAPSRSNADAYSDGAADPFGGGQVPLGETLAVYGVGGVPIEVLAGIARTAADPWEAASKLAATKAEPWEANLGLAATRSNPWEANRGLAGTASDPWEALRALAATRQDPWEANLSIAATRSDPWEANLGLAALPPSPVVDDEYDAGTSAAAFGDASGEAAIAEPFTLAAGQQISYVNCRIAKTGSPGDNVVLNIYADASGLPSGPSLATASVVGSSLGTSQSDLVGITFALPAPFSHAAGTYWIALSRSGALDVANYYKWIYRSSGGVAGATFNGTVWGNSIHAFQYRLGLLGSMPWEANRGLAATRSDPWEALQKVVSSLMKAGVPPTTPILDNFNRADENPLSGGGNWANGSTSFASQLKIVGGAVTAGGTAHSYWTPATFTDCEAYATIGTGGSRCVVAARVQSPGGASNPVRYGVDYSGAAAELDLFRVDGAGAVHLLGVLTSFSLSAGDKVGIRCVGTTIEAWTYSAGVWTLRLSATDASISAAGYLMLGNNGVGTVDDFGGGNGGAQPWEANLGLAATRSDPWEANLGLAATRSDPWEANLGLAATRSDPWEANLGLAATRSDPWEANLGLAATRSDPWEALAALAATRSDPWEANRGLAASGSEPWETLRALAATLPEPWESLAPLAATRSAPWEALLGLSGSTGAPWEAPGGISSPRGDPWEALAALSASGSAPWEALLALAATRSDPWEASLGVTQIAATAELPWEAGLGLAGTRGLPYEALRALAASADLPLEALRALAALASLPLEALVELAASESLPLEALLRLAATASAPWESGGGVQVTATAELPYEALAGLARSLGNPWSALAALSRPAAAPWSSLVVVRQTGALPYEALRLLLGSAVLPWEAGGQAATAGGGVGGSGMSDEEYRRLLRRLGALREGMSDEELAAAVVALRTLGLF